MHKKSRLHKKEAHAKGYVSKVPHFNSSQGALVTAMVSRITPRDIPTPGSSASVSVEATAGKLNRGKTYNFQVRVDLTGVSAPASPSAWVAT